MNKKNRVYNFQYSDAGRDRRQIHDCAVRALALAASLQYSKAYHLLRRAGRKHNKGTDLCTLLQALKLDGIQYLQEPAKITVEQFLAKYPKGKFILNMSEHFSVAIDGVHIDTNSHFGKLVYSYYKLL